MYAAYQTYVQSYVWTYKTKPLISVANPTTVSYSAVKIYKPRVAYCVFKTNIFSSTF
jgi:hypothetical protein